MAQVGEFQIEVVQPFDLRRTVRSYGWVNLGPFRWSEAEGIVSWSPRVGSVACSLEVFQPDSSFIAIRVNGGAPSKDVKQVVSRALMLDWEPAMAVSKEKRLDAGFARLLRQHAGQLLHGRSPFEDVVKTICTINTS